MGGQAVRCADCGLEADPGSPQSICVCGWTLKKQNDKNAGVRCFPNPNPSLDVPEQILVRYVNPDGSPTASDPSRARVRPGDHAPDLG